MLYVCRRTFGFHKEEDRISFTQFVNGLKKKDGKILDMGSGLARSSVNEALTNLEYSGVLIIRRETEGNHYKINLNIDVEEVVRKTYQSRERLKKARLLKPKQKRFKVLVRKPYQYGEPTKSSTAAEPKVVRLPNLQKKGNIGNKELVVENLSNWNSKQSSPIRNFKAENIVNKHGVEKIERIIKTFGPVDDGFSLALAELKK